MYSSIPYNCEYIPLSEIDYKWLSQSGYQLLSAGKLDGNSQPTIHQTYYKISDKPYVKCYTGSLNEGRPIAKSDFYNSPIHNFEIYGEAMSGTTWALYPHSKNEFSFKFDMQGSEIVKIHTKIGFDYAKIEKLLRNNNIFQNLNILNRLYGFCSNNHLLAYSNLVELNYGITDEISDEVKYIRIIITELEHVNNHLLWLATTFYLIRLNGLFKHIWELRKEVDEILNALNSLNTALIIPGGINLNENKITQLTPKIAYWKSRIINFSEEESIKLRTYTQNQAILETKQFIGAVGPTARSGGQKIDARVNFPYCNYDQIQINSDRTNDQGDLWSLICIRSEEILQSFDILEQCLEKVSRPVQKPVDLYEMRTIDQLHISIVEAPAGILQYSGKISGKGRFDLLNINVPTICNFQSVVNRIIVGGIKYIPLAFKGIEMGINPNDTIQFEDIETDSQKKITLNALNNIAVKSIINGNNLNIKNLSRMN